MYKLVGSDGGTGTSHRNQNVAGKRQVVRLYFGFAFSILLGAHTLIALSRAV